MHYRYFGKDGWNVSALGFGAMRLPLVAGTDDIDEEQAIHLLRSGVDRGINYIDTAYFYHGGKSETVVGAALRDGYREKVRVATKLPVHLVNTVGDAERLLDEQLARLGIDCVDYYLFHGLNKSHFEKMLKLDLINELLRFKDDGRIRRIGFSFHDTFSVFKQIVDHYDGWDMCQLQYNYMDVYNQAGIKGLQYAASRNIPVVVMEPLLGGRLTKPVPEVEALFEKCATTRSAAEWALSWVLNHPEVAAVLSGMNAMDQLEENCRIADTAQPDSLSDEVLQTITKARSIYNKRTVIPCTQCNYCMPCPEGVEIPWNFSEYNSGKMYDDASAPRFVYENFMKPQQRASACIACKKCEDRCPQNIPISGWMPKVHNVLGEGKSYGD